MTEANDNVPLEAPPRPVVPGTRGGCPLAGRGRRTSATRPRDRRFQKGSNPYTGSFVRLLHGVKTQRAEETLPKSNEFMEIPGLV